MTSFWRLASCCSSKITTAVFSKVSHNYGPESNAWQYVRQVDEGPQYGGGTYVHLFQSDLSLHFSLDVCADSHDVYSFAEFAPIYTLYDNDIRCGRGAAKHGKGVETLNVIGGDTLSFYSTQLSDDSKQEVDVAGLCQSFMRLSKKMSLFTRTMIL